VAIFAQRIIAGEPCKINGNGTKVRDFVYAGDIAQANLIALERGSGVYNIGTGVPTTIGDLFQSLTAVNPGYHLPPEYGPDRQGEVWVSCLNSDRARAELGWEPCVPLSEGLRRTADYFRREGAA
jgi:UDP-glucose 4-epimerase